MATLAAGTAASVLAPMAVDFATTVGADLADQFIQVVTDETMKQIVRPAQRAMRDGVDRAGKAVVNSSSQVIRRGAGVLNRRAKKITKRLGRKAGKLFNDPEGPMSMGEVIDLAQILDHVNSFTSLMGMPPLQVGRMTKKGDMFDVVKRAMVNMQRVMRDRRYAELLAALTSLSDMPARIGISDSARNDDTRNIQIVDMAIDAANAAGTRLDVFMQEDIPFNTTPQMDPRLEEARFDSEQRDLQSAKKLIGQLLSRGVPSLTGVPVNHDFPDTLGTYYSAQGGYAPAWTDNAFTEQLTFTYSYNGDSGQHAQMNALTVEGVNLGLIDALNYAAPGDTGGGFFLNVSGAYEVITDATTDGLLKLRDQSQTTSSFMFNGSISVNPDHRDTYRMKVGLGRISRKGGIYTVVMQEVAGKYWHDARFDDIEYNADTFHSYAHLTVNARSTEPWVAVSFSYGNSGTSGGWLGAQSASVSMITQKMDGVNAPATYYNATTDRWMASDNRYAFNTIIEAKVQPADAYGYGTVYTWLGRLTEKFAVIFPAVLLWLQFVMDTAGLGVIAFGTEQMQSAPDIIKLAHGLRILQSRVGDDARFRSILHTHLEVLHATPGVENLLNIGGVRPTGYGVNPNEEFSFESRLQVRN